VMIWLSFPRGPSILAGVGWAPGAPRGAVRYLSNLNNLPQAHAKTVFASMPDAELRTACERLQGLVSQRCGPCPRAAECGYPNGERLITRDFLRGTQADCGIMPSRS
jgi:hypothetical protein